MYNWGGKEREIVFDRKNFAGIARTKGGNSYEVLYWLQKTPLGESKDRHRRHQGGQRKGENVHNQHLRGEGDQGTFGRRQARDLRNGLVIGHFLWFTECPASKIRVVLEKLCQLGPRARS